MLEIEVYSKQDNLPPQEHQQPMVLVFIEVGLVEHLSRVEVETVGPTFLDFQKPRTTKTIEDQSIIYNTGPTIRVNNAYGVPKIGLGNTFTVSLRDTRIGSASTIAAGAEIGLARVYDYALESGSYNSTNAAINEWMFLSLIFSHLLQ